MELSTEQQKAIERIRAWYTGRSGWIQDASAPFRLFGAAGTGKTTIAKHLQDALGVDYIAFGAYTGKAASVLRRKGVDATTIHSAIYQPRGTFETRRKLQEAQQDRMATDPDETERITELEAEIAQLERELATNPAGFTFNPDCEWADADLICLDEVSMVNVTMAADIESLGVPVLVLGDPHQLPPVYGEGYYINAEPDVLLGEVHRQALESPVLRLATDIRQGADWRGERVRVSLAEAMKADQVLVWKNSTRWNLIHAIRAKQGKPKDRPVTGDQVMCLTNNRQLGVLNGQQYEVLDIKQGDPTGPEMLLREIDGRNGERWIKAFKEGFQGLAAEQEMKKNFVTYRGEWGAFTFADVITTHKAQGSEWPHVYVVDQTDQMRTDARKWMYTAVTRASERVTIAHTGVR